MTNRPQLIDAVEVTDTGVHLVRLKRTFDATNVNEFEKVLAYLLSRQQYRIVVDLTQVEFVASAGWGAFTAEFRNVRKAGGDIRLAGMNPDVQDVFFLLELDSFINAYETIDEAIASFDAEHAANVVAENSPLAATEPEPAYEAEVPQPRLPGGNAPVTNFEAEPMAFEVAEVYEPEYRAPLALGAGAKQTQAPEYEPLAPAEDDAESWVITEEVETAAAEMTTYSARESFAAFAPEVDFNTLDEVAEEEAAPRDFVQDAKPALPAPSAPPANANEEEWPETQTEENLAAEDFEMQDIHDPWILEEIDTLPEEDELEATNWDEEVEAAPALPAPVPTTPRRAAPAPSLPKAIAAPVSKPANVRERAAVQAPAPQMPPAPTMRSAVAASTTRTLADKVKAASQSETTFAPAPLLRGDSESEHVQRVREIVSAHPEYGPAMIQKYFETQFEPPMQVSRSTIYRWLRLADLNTREQRLAFAGKAESVLP